MQQKKDFDAAGGLCYTFVSRFAAWIETLISSGVNKKKRRFKRRFLSWFRGGLAISSTFF